MSSAELSFWDCMGAKEYLGQERDDYRSARIETAIAEWAGRSLKEDAKLKVTDSMPFLAKDEPKPTKKRWTRKKVVEQSYSVFGAILAREGKTDLLKKQQADLKKLRRAKGKSGVSR